MAETERSLSTVLSDIVGDVQHIIRAEVRLAKVEVTEDVAKAKRGGIFLAAAAVAMVMALAFAELAVMFALATIWPIWAAALVLTLINGVVGAVMLSVGASAMKRIHLPPPRTVETVKETLQWAKMRSR